VAAERVAGRISIAVAADAPYPESEKREVGKRKKKGVPTTAPELETTIEEAGVGAVESMMTPIEAGELVEMDTFPLVALPAPLASVNTGFVIPLVVSTARSNVILQVQTFPTEEETGTATAIPTDAFIVALEVGERYPRTLEEERPVMVSVKDAVRLKVNKLLVACVGPLLIVDLLKTFLESAMLKIGKAVENRVTFK
jgi:hypothetical protein